MIRPLPLLALLAIAACGDASGTSPDGPPAAIRIAAGDGQTGAPGMPLPTDVVVVVTSADGAALAGADVAFEVTGGDGFVLPAGGRTDADGRASTRWYLGPRAVETQTLAARVGSNLAVTLNATATTPGSGVTYLGRNGYIEYQAGTLPLILSAPHGGTLTPGEIRDRTYGTTDRDTNTEELVREIALAFEHATGSRPHIVISRLHRSKLDPNREIVEAAQGNAYAEHAWREWNTFLGAARAVVAQKGGGLYIDLHGHGHAIPRLELGYMLTAAELALPTATLAGPTYVNRSSIRALVQRTGRTLPELLTGADALGTLFENAGVPAVPSAPQPHPGNDPYFSGGYNTLVFGSRNGGTVDGVQLESHFNGVRNTAAARTTFANTLVAVLRQYYRAHYGVEL